MVIDITREGTWDVTHKDALAMCEREEFYFDPELSYETSGYRPITQTKGLDFDPAPFTEVGRFKDETGKFTNLPWGTKAHVDWWKQQFEYCKSGFSANGYYITNDNYFFLNFYTMLNAAKIGEAGSGIDDSRPAFWGEHYKYFHYIDLCRKLDFDSVLLKARAVGASETGASIAVRPFITIKNSKSLFTAYSEGYLKGVLSKCWKQLNWLDMNSELAMKRLRQVQNSALHKRASMLDKTGIESGHMAEIAGMIVDEPDKLRGDRVENLFFEEAGSNNVLLSTYAVGEPLVIIGGKRRGTRFVFGTGGCLVAGSLVYDASGTITKIEDLCQESGIIGHNTKKSTKEEITYMHGVCVKPCVRITTSLGKTIECSTDHPIYTKYARNTARGRVEKTEFVDAKKIKINDEVAIPRIVPYFGSKSVKNAEQIGEMIGYNYFTPRGTKNIDTIPSSLYKKMSEYGIIEDGYIKQFIPEEILSSNKKTICSFLRGLMKTPGCFVEKKGPKRVINTYKITFLSVDNEFIKTIMLLLQKIGVHGLLAKRRWPESYNGYIYIFSTLSNLNAKTFVDTVDVTGLSVFEEIKSKFSNLKANTDPLIYERVVFVEDIGYNEVYNLEAGTTNTYIGNGILTHNSPGPMLSGLKQLFLDPQTYKVLPYRNNYTNSGDYVLTGFFIPAWSTVIDAMDNRGVVNEEKAREHYLKIRKKLSADPVALIKHCAESCFTHEEALSREGQNDFNQARLATQRSEIENLKRVPKPYKGYLHWVYKGSDSNEIVGVRWEDNPLGDIEIVEHPIYDNDGFPIRNLYIGGVDSIDLGVSDSTEGESKFCIVIKKRTFGTGGNQYVCKYLKRPNDVREAYGTAARILWYYGCKANLEDTKIAFRTWLREKKWDSKMLINRPQYALNDQRKRNATLWGTPATPKIIMHGLELVRDHIEDYCQNINFIEMIDQLQRYSYENKGKFDIVAAMCMAEIGDEDMYNLVAKNTDGPKREWNDVGYYFDNKGIRHYGIIPKYEPANTDIVNELKRQGYKF